MGKIKEFARGPEIRELCLGADGVVGFLCQLPRTGVALVPTSTSSRWRCACARYSFWRPWFEGVLKGARYML